MRARARAHGVFVWRLLWYGGGYGGCYRNASVVDRRHAACGNESIHHRRRQTLQRETQTENNADRGADTDTVGTLVEVRDGERAAETDRHRDKDRDVEKQREREGERERESGGSRPELAR